ncbi:MAG: lactate utilization protein [Oscillospiraceae bacterium]|nr:lactate utilization protein [Oscillospiraceae bacterium]
MDFTAVKTNLEKKGYKVVCFANSEEAAAYLDEQINETSVGFGGSVTVTKMGLYERLGSHNDVRWHYRVPEGMTHDQMRRLANSAEVYISSVNGLAETGEIINIDGACNRIAAVFYGPRRIFLLVGRNKLAKDYDAALWRARNIASPLNAKRLGVKTPCAQKGDKCYDCSSPERICCGLSVLWAKPKSADITVVLMDEEIGY